MQPDQLLAGCGRQHATKKKKSNHSINCSQKGEDQPIAVLQSIATKKEFAYSISNCSQFAAKKKKMMKEPEQSIACSKKKDDDHQIRSQIDDTQLQICRKSKKIREISYRKSER